MKLFRKSSRNCKPFFLLVLSVCASQFSPTSAQWGNPQQQPGGQFPLQQPGGQIPQQQPGGQYPLQQPGGQIPQQQPGGQYPLQQPAGQFPQQQPAGQYPQQQPGGQYPSQQPGGQFPQNPIQQQPPLVSQDGYYISSYPQGSPQGSPQGNPQGYPQVNPTGNPQYPSSETGVQNYDDQQTECTAQSRLVGGTNAQWNDAPFMVSLRELKNDHFNNFGLGHFCGGTLIHPYLVLTAASCIANRVASDIGVVVGTLNRRKQASSSQLLFVQKMIPHPSYTFQTGGHDIGVILLKTAAFIGPRVKLATLAYKDPRAGSDCALYGWGQTTSQGQLYTDCLRKAVVKVQDLEECKRNFQQVSIKIPPSVFCAGYFGGGPDACQGDIGGPAICDGNFQGIISNKVGCGTAGAGKIYTNIYSFRNWIEYTTTSLKAEFENMYPEGSLNMRSDVRDDAPPPETAETSGVQEKCVSVGLALAAGLALMLA